MRDALAKNILLYSNTCSWLVKYFGGGCNLTIVSIENIVVRRVHNITCRECMYTSVDCLCLFEQLYK